MGLIADIYSHDRGNCSAGGISSRCQAVTVVNASGPFEPNDERPAVIIREGYGNGGTVHAVPAEPDGQGGWVAKDRPMMGGTYIATSDSRFGELVRSITGQAFYGAVAFHDRYEVTA